MIRKFVQGVALASALLFASSAFAATIPATTVFDGQTQVWGNAGQTVQATFRVHVAAGEVVHAIRTKVDTQATVCAEVGPYEGEQDVDVPVTITLPPNTNTSGYNLTGELFTTATLPQAQAMTGNLACTGANTNAYNGVNVLHVLPTSGTTSGSTGPSSWQVAFAQLSALIASVIHPAPAPTPTPAPVPTTNDFCVRLATKTAGAAQGVTNYQNGILQGFLIGEGESIALLQNNQAKYGFWGDQTNGALLHFKGIHGCN